MMYESFADASNSILNFVEQNKYEIYCIFLYSYITLFILLKYKMKYKTTKEKVSYRSLVNLWRINKISFVYEL